jgi:hypothetical protein
MKIEVVKISMSDREIDITRGIKIVEWLKSEILTDIAALFKELLNSAKDNSREVITETISNIIIVAYLIAKRYGIGFEVVDIKIENKLKLGIIEEHDLERLYGDLSGLAKHLNFGRKKSNRGD